MLKLKECIDRHKRNNPDFAQQRIAERAEVDPAALSLYLCHGVRPKKSVGQAFDEKILKTCRELGIRVYDPPEKNFEGLQETRKKQLGKNLYAWYLLNEAGVSVKSIAGRFALSNATLCRYFAGEIPSLATAAYEIFMEALEIVLHEHFTPAAIEGYGEIVSREEALERRKKRKKREDNRMLINKGQKYFDFKTESGEFRNPFKSLDIRSTGEIYLGDTYREILEQAFEALQDKQFTAVTGPTGSGKSILKWYLEEQIRKIPAQNGRRRVLELPEAEALKAEARNGQYFTISPGDVLAGEYRPVNVLSLVLNRLGIDVHKSMTTDQKEYVFLEALHKSERTPVLLFDEANRRNEETLRVLKTLVELNRSTQNGNERILSVVVFGQEIGFSDRIEYIQKLQEVRQRAVILRIPALPEREIAGYIESRLALVGKKTEDVFTERALRAIVDQAKRTGATPLRINNIVTDALVEKFKLDPHSDERKIDVGHVMGA